MIWENTLSGMVDSTASRFDAASTYKKSDYVWYAATGVKPKLYKAKDDMAAGAWDASKWEEISATTEFANKESLITKNKTLNGKIEFDGNDLVIKRGKCYKFYATDPFKTYHAGDFVCGYVPPVDLVDFVEPAKIASGFAPYYDDDPDCEFAYDDVLNFCEDLLEEDYDTGTLTPNPHGDFSQVPEGFLEKHYDYDAGCSVPYKIHQDGTFEKLSADKKVSALTAAEFQAKGYSMNDFVFADGALIPGGESWQPTTGIQYVEPSPERTSIMDLAMMQDEIAPSWENMADKHYGSLFYYNYELYALVSVDEEYDQQISFRDSAKLTGLTHLTDLGDYVWANKISTFEDLLQIGSSSLGYSCTHALFFNIFSSDSSLKVLPTNDGCIKINGGLGVGRVVVSNVNMEFKEIVLDWDLRGENASISFSFDENEAYEHEPLIGDFNIRNGLLDVYCDNASIGYDEAPYYSLCYDFNAINATVRIMSRRTSVAIGKDSNVYKNSKLFYYCYGSTIHSFDSMCYITNTTLEDSYMKVGETDTLTTTVGYDDIGCSNFKANNSTIIFDRISDFERIEGDLVNCEVRLRFWVCRTDGIKYLNLIEGQANYCTIIIEDFGSSKEDMPTLAGKQIVSDIKSSYNNVIIFYKLTDDHIPTMYPYAGTSRSYHIGNAIFVTTVEADRHLKWHDFPTT